MSPNSVKNGTNSTNLLEYDSWPFAATQAPLFLKLESALKIAIVMKSFAGRNR